MQRRLRKQHNIKLACQKYMYVTNIKVLVDHFFTNDPKFSAGLGKQSDEQYVLGLHNHSLLFYFEVSRHGRTSWLEFWSVL